MIKEQQPTQSRRRFDLAGHWDGVLTLNDQVDVAAADEVRRVFQLPLPWNVQVEDLRWPSPTQELSGIVRPIQNQNFRDVQRKFNEGTIVLTRTIQFQPAVGQRLFLVFEGSNYQTTAVVNGEEVGRHSGGHLSFEFEVTNQMQPGSNEIQITVDNLRRKDAAPQEQFNWQNYGGVYRPFYIESRPKQYIEHASVTPVFEDGNWHAEIEARFDSDVAGEVEVEIHSGDVVETAKIAVEGDGFKSRLTMASEPIVWEPGVGGMSRYRITLTPRDAEADVLEGAFGFRTVELVGTQVHVNSKPLRIFGAAMHEQYPACGNAVPAYQAERDLRLLLHCGFNAVRTAHYPHAQTFYDACDRLGVLCLAELPCWQFNDYHFGSSTVLNICKDFANRMVTQLGNHPSIIGWIVQNESKTFEPGAKEFFGPIAQVFKQRDPSRFTTSAESPTPPEHLAVVKKVKGTPQGPPAPTVECVDVLGVNNYAGWYEEKSDYLPALLDHVHEQIPEKPLLITEFGGEGILGQRTLSMHPWTEDYQAELICRHLREILDRPFVAGFVLWLFIDYECASIGIRAINAKGLVDEYRRPKLAFNMVKQLLEAEGSS